MWPCPGHTHLRNISLVPRTKCTPVKPSSTVVLNSKQVVRVFRPFVGVIPNCPLSSLRIFFRREKVGLDADSLIYCVVIKQQIFQVNVKKKNWLGSNNLQTNTEVEGLGPRIGQYLYVMASK